MFKCTVEYLASPAKDRLSLLDVFRHLTRVDQAALRTALRALPYADFLKTPYWLSVSATVKARALKRCVRCRSRHSLNVHHEHYKNHGAEHLHLEDLVCVCRKCHDYHHNMPDRMHERGVKLRCSTVLGSRLRY